MRAIILSAGQGKRLLPLTESCPKCLLPVADGRTVLDVQLQALAQAGVRRATVMVGFGAEQVEKHLRDNPVPGIRVDTFYNPLYKITDNLITVWLARHMMVNDFIILNGDTLFDPAVLERLLASPKAPLTIAINEKDDYDSDDMKVSLNGGRRLRAVGKTLDAEFVHGESIGLMLFRGQGAELFRQALDIAVRQEQSVSAWYLSVVNALCETTPVETASITGLWWGEVDSPEDLACVRSHFDEEELKETPRAWAASGGR
jgi:choline kinase